MGYGIVAVVVFACLMFLSEVEMTEAAHGGGQNDSGENFSWNAKQGNFIFCVNQFMMYEVSKIYDKKNGSDAKMKMVREILDKADLKNVILNPRIEKCIRTKIALLMKKVKGANKKGGKCRKKLLSSFKNHQNDFKLHVSHSELNQVASQSILDETKAMLFNANEKICRLEGQLSSQKKSLGFWKNRLRDTVQRMINAAKTGRGREKGRTFGSYSERTKRRLKKEIKIQCDSALNFLGFTDLVPTEVKYFNASDNCLETIQLVDTTEMITEEENNEDSLYTEPKKLDHVYMLLFIKEKFHISDRAWQELSLRASNLPSLYSLKQRIAAMNDLWNVKPTPGPYIGMQLKLKDSLIEQSERMFLGGLMDREIDIIKIKFSGDGTRVGKHLQLLTVSYTIITAGNVAQSLKGNHVIAVVKTKDDYEAIKCSLADLMEEMRNLKVVTVNGKEYCVHIFLGGDWKFLASVCGIGPANHNYACIWCTCPKSQRYDVTKKWSLTDTSMGARTIGSIIFNSRSRKLNCQRLPLFDFIPMDHVLIDTLHLFLRITDILIDNLIRTLRKEDEKARLQSTPCTHVQGFLETLKGIGISFHMTMDKTSGDSQYRTFTGPEKIMIFEKIDITAFLSSPEAPLIQSLWKDFFHLYTQMRGNFATSSEIEAFSICIDQWTIDFLHLYQNRDVTPYMHAFRAHVPEFLSLYGNIAQFNQQGLEKYNDQVSKDYFRSTNHRNVESLKELILKRNRVEYLSFNEADRIKRVNQCSNCLERGHTIKTCTSQCSDCTVITCCSHLQKVECKWVKACQIPS